MAIKAKLTTFDTTMIVVSLVIGIGIFRTPAIVAGSTQTPFLFFTAWILGGLISLFGALTYAEIGSRFSKPGAFYKVVAESYHSAFAFMLNWASVLVVNGAGAAAVAMIGAEYLNPVILPARLQTQLATQLTATGLIIFLVVINYLGIKTGAWAQNILSLMKIGMILLLVLAAFRSRGIETPGPVEAVATRPFWIALASGLISVFYTYGGYQCTINFGADVKRAQRKMPTAIFFGIFIIIACYLLINAAYYKILGITGIAQAKLVAAELAHIVLGKMGYLFISLAIFFSAMGFVNVTLMQIPRAYYAMAEDGALPYIFKRVNSKTQVQEFTLLFFGATILLSIYFLGTFENLVNYVMFIDSLNLAVVASTLFSLRRKARLEGSYGGYKVPLYPLLPAIFVLFLFSVSLNVLLTQTRPALFGIAIFSSGYPIFLFMRKISKKKTWNHEA